MSLSHLGKFSEPVFDAALPVKPVIFPVARRVVSHAARSLFAGKLLFPVAIPGKEGQHCFVADPRRLFRMPRVKFSTVSVFPPVVPMTEHAFAPPPPVQTQPRQRLDIVKGRLPPRPEMKPRPSAACGMPDLSLAEPRAQPSVRSIRPQARDLREPLYPQKCLISRFERSRLRRMATTPDRQSASSPRVELSPASPPPDNWAWFALSTRGWSERSEARTRPLQIGPLDPPRPRLLYPTATVRSAAKPSAFGFQAHGRPALSPWRPVCRLHTERFSILPLQRRLPFTELVSGSPAPSVKDRHIYFNIYINDSISILPHSHPSPFEHGRGSLRPSAHTGTSPALLPADRLAAPTARTGATTEILANIARARLADIRGAPPARLLRNWPRAAFRTLRQLLFRQPFSRHIDLLVPEASGFRVIAPRAFPSLRASCGFLGAATTRAPDSTRAKPAERRVCRTFVHFREERLPSKTDFPLPAERAIDLHMSAIQAPPVFLVVGTTRKGVRQKLGISRGAVVGNALFTLGEKRHPPFGSSPVPTRASAGTSDLRIPVPAMQILGLTASPRGPRPPALPRRLPPAGEPERMIRHIASLPRRSHSTKHYLLSLEASLMDWKQLPQPRRPRIAQDRVSLVPRPRPFLREIMLTETFKSVSPGRERAFLTTVIPTPPHRLHEVGHPAARRISHERPPVSPHVLPLAVFVTGAQFLDAPEWVRPIRQPRMKIRYWPTFYEFPPSIPSDGMRFSEIGRTPIPPSETSRELAHLAGIFGIRRRERPRGPYSMRRPKRWLLKTDPSATGIPVAYRHETTVPTTSPSRLDAAERHPPAFMGPAFRSPWTSVVSNPEEFRQFVSERAAPPSPERIAHCRASVRPAVEPALMFQEAPMPRAITTARSSPMPSPCESLRIDFSSQSFRPIGPIASDACREPPTAVRHDTLRRIEAFVEFQPDLFSDGFPEPAAGAGFFIRDLLCDLIVFHGAMHARWRSLFFPYKPDVPDVGTTSLTPIEPTPESLLQNLLYTKEPIELDPGILFPEQEFEEPPTVQTEMAPIPYVPNHLLDAPIHRLPVILPDVFGFDILEAPAAPAEESDFSASMYVPFIPAPLPQLLRGPGEVVPPPVPFPQTFSEEAPPVSWPRRHAPVSESFPSLEQPSAHAIIIAGRLNRRLLVAGGFRARHEQPSPALFSGIHRLELPPLPKDAYQALHIVDLAPATIACRSLLSPAVQTPWQLTLPVSCGPLIDADISPASRSSILPYLQMPVRMAAGRFRHHEITGPAPVRRISFRKQEFGSAVSSIGLLSPLAMPILERKERGFSSKFKTSIPCRAAVHLAAIPDWLELSSSRPACRPPTTLQPPT